MPRRISALYGFRGGMCSTDYLVICGRAFARSMQSASATLESPLDSSKHIIAQLLCPVQRIPDASDASVPAIDIVHQSGFLGALKVKTEQSVSGIPTRLSLRFRGH